MKVPAGQLGSQLQGFAGQLTGNTNSSSEVTLPLSLGGTYNDPKVTLLAQEQKQQVKEAVTTVVKEKATDAVKEVVSGGNPKEVISNLLKTPEKKDSTQQTQTQQPTDTTKKAPVEQLLQNKLNSLLKKKKN